MAFKLALSGCVAFISLGGLLTSAAGQTTTPDAASQKGYSSLVATLWAIMASAIDSIQFERTSGQNFVNAAKALAKANQAINPITKKPPFL
jgi:hypothetical protein